MSNSAESMLSAPEFLPILQAPGWDGREHVVCKSIFESVEPQESESIFVAYGLNDGAMNQYMMKKVLYDYSEAIDTVHEAALANIERKFNELEWQEDEWGGAKVLFLGGDEYTSSTLVSQTMLNQVHDYFGEEQLYIGVPSRFTLVVSSDPLVFPHVVKDLYDDAVRDNAGELSPYCYVSHGKQLVGQTNFPDEDSTETEEQGDISEEFDEETLTRICLSGPVAVFLMISAADGDIDKKELKCFLDEVINLSTKAGVPEELKALFSNLPEHLQEIVGLLMGESFELETLTKSLLASCALVEEQLGSRKSKKYNKILIDLAVAVAGASGGFFGFGSKIDKNEKAVIEGLKKLLDVK